MPVVSTGSFIYPSKINIESIPYFISEVGCHSIIDNMRSVTDLVEVYHWVIHIIKQSLRN
ncbi:hypothetical protein D3C85_1062150 [compost metagenome]